MQSQVIAGRVRLVFILIALFSLGLIYRLYTIQIVSGEEFSQKADRQYISDRPELINRGSIFFTTKDGERVTAAHQETGNIIAVNPTLITDSESIFSHISSFITLNKEEFLKKANKKDDPYEEVAKKIDFDLGEKISQVKFPGLLVFKQKWRTYPAGMLAANVLGFMAYDTANEVVGQYGLERQYEKTLVRKGESVYTNFFVEIFSDISETISDTNDKQGDIVTTIEPTVQSYFEKNVDNITKKWSSEFSGGIIMDPRTGEIIAMSQNPTFDPNNFSQVEDPRIFSNRLVEDVYEMGSIMKPITVAAGIDAGVITPQSTYDDKGYLILNNSRISNYDGKGRGVVDMQEVLNQSLNTGVAHIANKLGRERFARYLKSFGIDKKTGIDLPFEAMPLADNLDSPRDIELATASYGQGIAMSPTATLRALSVLANGGKLPNPHVVSAVTYRTGLAKNIEAGDQLQVIKPETSEAVTRMLVRVVDEALLAGTIKLERYSVAAKTGTAQIARSDGRGYYDDRYLHSFFGYFPAYNPQYIVFLYTYYPKNVTYASETLAQSFNDITKYLINYYDIQPDR